MASFNSKSIKNTSCIDMVPHEPGSSNVPEPRDTTETDVCLAADASVDYTSSSDESTSVKPRKTTGLTLAEWYVLLREELSTDDLKESLIPYFKMIDDSATNLKGRDFKDLSKTVRGLGTSQLAFKTAYVIKEAVKDYYGKDFDEEDFYYTIDALERFSTALKDCRGNSKIFFKDASKIMAALKEKNLLTEEMCLIYVKMNEEKDDIQKRLDEFHYIDLSGIAEYIRSLEITGLLSDVLLTKFKTFVDEAKDSCIAFESQLNRMKDFANIFKDVQKNPAKLLNYKPISEENVEVLKHIGKKNILSKASERKKHLKAADKESKPKVCRLEHNKPFCSNCGWLTYWLKSFKKRGVYVKEAVDTTKEHIWNTDMKKG